MQTGVLLNILNGALTEFTFTPPLKPNGAPLDPEILLDNIGVQLGGMECTQLQASSNALICPVCRADPLRAAR